MAAAPRARPEDHFTPDQWRALATKSRWRGLVLSAPFPVSPASLRRKMWRDLSGQTFFKQRLQPLWNTLRGLGGKASGSDGESAFGGRDLRFLVANALGFAVFAAAGWWWVWLVLWLLPMASWLPLVTRLRNIAEHALVAVNEPDPLRQARTTQAGWLERAFIAPYWVNYHAEHHMFTQLPCWQLPKAHALLRAAGTTARMEVQPGYRRMLQLATTPRAAAA